MRRLDSADMERNSAPVANQSVGIRDDGRVAISGPDTGVMTEYQSTVDSPYGPGYVNMPTIFQGVPMTVGEAYQIMLENGWIDPDTGSSRYQITYPNPEAAVNAAKKRSGKLTYKNNRGLLD